MGRVYEQSGLLSSVSSGAHLPADGKHEYSLWRGKRESKGIVCLFMEDGYVLTAFHAKSKFIRWGQIPKATDGKTAKWETLWAQ